MTFTVLIYAIGGYAAVFLAGMLVLETVRGPVRQAASLPRATDPQLRAWPRTARRCPVTHESALPLRTARLSVPARRRRRAPMSCRR